MRWIGLTVPITIERHFVLVDSNLLIYAINSSSPKHQIAQKFIRDHSGEFTLAHQNILEVLRVLTHPKFPSPMEINHAAEALSRIVDAAQLIFPALETYHVAITMIKDYKIIADKIYDAYLVATMLSNGITEIATDNEKDFRIFPQLKIINPFKETVQN